MSGVRRRVDRDILLEDKGDGGCGTGRPVDLEGLAQDCWDIGPVKSVWYYGLNTSIVSE